MTPSSVPSSGTETHQDRNNKKTLKKERKINYVTIIGNLDYAHYCHGDRGESRTQIFSENHFPTRKEKWPTYQKRMGRIVILDPIVRHCIRYWPARGLVQWATASAG